LKSIGKSVGNCAPEHAHIGFAASVGKSVSKVWQACSSVCAPSIGERVGIYVGNYGMSVGKTVSNCGKMP
jgi:hypothetical protein